MACFVNAIDSKIGLILYVCHIQQFAVSTICSSDDAVTRTGCHGDVPVSHPLSSRHLADFESWFDESLCEHCVLSQAEFLQLMSDFLFRTFELGNLYCKMRQALCASLAALPTLVLSSLSQWASVVLSWQVLPSGELSRQPGACLVPPNKLDKIYFSRTNLANRQNIKS